jgi:membrane protease YdiL (CAAX protease family)
MKLDKLSALRPAAFPFVLYVLVGQLAHTLLNTIVSYIVSLSQKTGTDFSNTVNEIADQYLMLSFSMGALLLTLTLWQADRALYRHLPFWNDLHKPAWQLDRSRKEELLRGLSSGALAALVYLVFFVMSGQIGYLGVYITSTIGTPIFPLFFMDLAAIVALLLCEEFLFRHKILRSLLAVMPASSAIVLTACLHLLARHWQFHLEALDYINLACLNLVLGYFYVKSGKSHRGLGFLAALLCLLHNLGGLPLWGYESPSFFLFKASPRASALVTGGGSGPLAGLGIFGILAIFALGSFLTWKRDLEAKR